MSEDYTNNITEEPQNDKRREKREKRNNLIIILLILLLIIAVGVTVWAVFFRDGDSALVPDYAPQSVEENAEPIGDESGEKLEKPDGGGSASLIYSKDVAIDLSDRKADLLFGNPSRSNSDIVVRLVIRDKVILQSGRIVPGNRVTSLSLLEDAEKLLSPGVYNGKLVVFYYDSATGEKAMISTEIPVTITVRDK